MAPLVFSVVVPSGGSRTLAAVLDALAAQVDAPPFQVVVVLDGPTEAAAAVAGAGHPFEVMLLEQSKRGLCYARDLGAVAGRGELVLFIDEDEVADEYLLASLHDGHRNGADVLQPALEVHPAARPTVVAAFTRRWAATRRDRLSTKPLLPQDVCPTPLSMRASVHRALEQRLGPLGFAGSGVAEDFRIGHALNASGIRAHHLAAPACSTLVASTVGDLLALSEEMGLADAALGRETPGLAASISRARAERWVTAERERKTVAASVTKARRLSDDTEQHLMGQARRGIVPPDALTRIDRAVSARYWLGFEGSPG